jgi:type III secretion protein R
MSQTSSFPDPLFGLALILSITALPFLAVIATSYTKIVVVLGLLRNAIGVQQLPPNMVINAIALILSMFVMAPVIVKSNELVESSGLYDRTSVRLPDLRQAVDVASPPFREFLLKHTAPRERANFKRAAERLWPASQAEQLKDDDFRVLLPAFLATELARAFQIGFLIYLAFVVVDLVVANVLLAMGMQMLSPVTISVPFKLLLFVVLDGWSLLFQTLLLSYR